VTKLEQQLKKALEPVGPPEGFAERVLARAAAGNRARAERGRTSWWTELFAARGLRWGLASALCLALVASGALYKREQERRVAGEQAKDQLMLALRLTASKLQYAQTQVRQIGTTNQ
jgi:hypothetical protein